MSPAGKCIFVSYSHKDGEDTPLVQQVFTHLSGLQQSFPDVKIWIDQKVIRVGDQWPPEIDEALAAADLAVLIISPEFLASTFIKEKELERLLKRRDESGLRLVPILLKPCGWPKWLAATESRPRGDLALSEIHAKDPSAVDRALKQVIEEITEILRAAAPESTIPGGAAVAAAKTDTRRGGDMTETSCIGLLTETLLAGMAPDAAAALAGKLVGDIKGATGLAGGPLYDAVRFFIEFALLRSDEPTSPASLEKALAIPEKGGKAGPLLAPLRQRARTEDFSATPVEVSARFFGRTNKHADLWKQYFDRLIADGVAMESDVMSLVTIRVTMGFLSPQFLVAGLLSRFDDDWRPVLNAYQRSIPSRQGRGAFESLQASQWNCWLMWGPSIPVCQCDEWKGLCAIQYGYGDENNSIPVVEPVAEAGVPKTLGPILASLRAEGRGARFAVVTGRLRWGPFFLERQQQERVLRDDDDRLDEEPSGARLAVAAAQASMYDQVLAHRRDSDSVVLQLVRVDESLPESRVYYSAYLWAMFLATTGAESDQEPGIGPALLRGKRYPRWSADPADRRRLRDSRLWEDLLPVFVHANIGDPAALRFQRQILVENAVQLLRQVWERQAELFDARDVASGIRFHLVGASDYSGCGCEMRFPVEESLSARLRARVAAEPDRAFAESIVLPRLEETPQTRPWGLAGFFSACHLPEMIVNYYDHVAHLER
jgi:hypothetical protein